MPKKEFDGVRKSREEMARLNQDNSAKRVTELRNQIAELRKSSMIDRSTALQNILKSKIAEFERITGQ